jgi:ATP-dependent DNA helicase 2 subunit 2
MTMGTSNMIVAQKTNDKAVLALSSLIHALFELDSCAVARVVKKDNSEPLLTILSPSVEKDYECLIENQLPFNEDVRSYRFPPIDKIVTVSGKVLTEHRNLPSKDLTQAMSDFVDSMDISQSDKNDEGQPAEYMALEDAFSPVLHRIEQAKRWRAVRPTEPVPPIPEVLLKYSKQPDDLQENSKSALQKLMKTADVKKGT